MTLLLQALATALETPRELPAQTVKHLGGTYGITRDAIGAFLDNDLPGLEDYQIDLILSPLFTPKLQDQAIFADLLGKQSIPASERPPMIEQLVARPTRATLVLDNGEAHSVLLREVTIARYVNRLRLDGSIPASLFELIEHRTAAADRPLLKAIARRAVWDSDPRREIYLRYLTATCPGEFRIEDVLELLKVTETYEPIDVADMIRRIPLWQKVLRQEIDEAGSKPFFNERIKEMHGDGRDQRPHVDARTIAKENEWAVLDRLRTALSD